MDSIVKEMQQWPSFTSQDYKQMAVGATHGVGDFALSTASAFSHIGYGLSVPVRAASWAAGRGSFSQDWAAFQRSDQAFYQAGHHWMQSLLPGDRNHEMYQFSRCLVGGGLEMGSLVAGGYGVVKGAAKLGVMGLSKLAKMPRQGASTAFSGGIKLNRFDQAARNLSEVGQNNIRTLRGWAKSKDWVRAPNFHGGPEKWGTFQNGKFEWRLVIKPEASTRPGLHQGSNIPRFDARLLTDTTGQSYINPFTGEVGN